VNLIMFWVSCVRSAVINKEVSYMYIGVYTYIFISVSICMYVAYSYTRIAVFMVYFASC
jgi:hypothetical protein